MAYPPQQARFVNGGGRFYDAPRSAPLTSPREYRDDGYGGRPQQQQTFPQNDPYASSYNQNGPRRPPPQQQAYQQGPPRHPRGPPPPQQQQQRRPPPRGPGPNGPQGPAREKRGGGHRDRRDYNDQQYKYDNTYQQTAPRGYGNSHPQDHYHNEYNGHDQYQDQYDEGYDQGHYENEYGYQQNDEYRAPMSQQQYGSGGDPRAQMSQQQSYSQSNPQANYDQRGRNPSGGSGRPPRRSDGDRILQQEPGSPETVAWDNPFPTFPITQQARPSTASGRYQDPHGQDPQFPAPNSNFGPRNHNAGTHSTSDLTSSPQPAFAQEFHRSNTMPTDLAQNMANMNIQPVTVADEPPKRRSPPQHLNFSQPRRPSAGTPGSSGSRQTSQTRAMNNYEPSYDVNQQTHADNTQHIQPYASPGMEDMPNFGAVQNQEMDKSLHMAPQGVYDNGRGRQQDRRPDFQGEAPRSRSQPSFRHQGGMQGSSQDNAPAMPTMNAQYAGNTQNFPPRKASQPQPFQRSSPLQDYNQNQRQPQGRDEFGAPPRAQTDTFGPGQGPSRQISDPNTRGPNGIAAPIPRQGGVLNTLPGIGGNGYGSQGPTPAGSQRTSIEDRNGMRRVLSNGQTATNSDVKSIVNPDALPGHPTPARAGQPGNAGMSSTSSARPPPVRNYNGSPSVIPEQQISPPPTQYQQSPPPQPTQYQQPQPQSTQYQQKPSPQPQQASRSAYMTDGAITYQELQRLRDQVYQNPSDQALELYLAKRIAEAATVLADEGGRADPKTKAKNRDRYNKEALLLVKKLIGFGSTDAMFYMAECYGNGTMGLPRDAGQAFTMYQSAAKLNHAAAAYRVAVCCELGSDEGGGTRRDPLKAFQWYQRAATLGDVPAMYKTGVIQLKGLLGQPANTLQAVTWLKRAAERADAENPHAVHELALLYMNASPNDSIIRDEAYAGQLMQQAADLGYKFSQFRLGTAYEYGLMGLPIDARQSITWYSKAAQQEEHQSELALSGWYLTGAEGIMAQNDTEAYLWARKAANAGLAKAEYAMGYFTEVGIGCPAELEGAKRWYWKAASQNFPKARERLEDLRRGGPKMQKARVSRGTMQREQGDCKVM